MKFETYKTIKAAGVTIIDTKGAYWYLLSNELSNKCKEGIPLDGEGGDITSYNYYSMLRSSAFLLTLVDKIKNNVFTIKDISIIAMYSQELVQYIIYSPNKGLLFIDKGDFDSIFEKY